MFTLHKRVREFFSSFLIAIFLITPLSAFSENGEHKITEESTEEIFSDPSEAEAAQLENLEPEEIVPSEEKEAAVFDAQDNVVELQSTL